VGIYKKLENVIKHIKNSYRPTTVNKGTGAFLKDRKQDA
jgi:hypothetical protein